MLLLGIAFVIVPFIAFHRQRLDKETIQKKLDGIMGARPQITVKAETPDGDKAVLEVYNAGGDADFTAKGRVLSCGVGEGQYFPCWESVSDTKYHIDNGETASILVGVNAPLLVTPNYFGGYYGLWLVKMTESGKEVFSASSPIENEQRKLNKRYPTIAKKVAPDKCIIEFTITASPPLREAFDKHRYSLECDHEHENKLLFVDVSNPNESNPDKKGLRT